jgi:hypothetical protein
MLAMVVPWRLGRDAMYMLSHAADCAVGASWLQHDVDAESYWRQCCRVILVMVLPRRPGCGAM